MVDEAAELVEYQICILLELNLLFFFARLHESFQALEAFLENVAVTSFDPKSKMVPISAALPSLKLLASLFAAVSVLHFESKHVLYHVAPIDGVAPDAMISDQRAQVDFSLPSRHVMDQLAALQHHVEQLEVA